MYRVRAKQREKEREKIRETALEIIEEKGFVLCSDLTGRIKGISHYSMSQYLKHNYEKWGLVRRSYGRDLSERKWAYAVDSKKIPPPPPKEITKPRPEIPKRVEELIERARRVDSVSKSPRKKPKKHKLTKTPGETLDDWLIRIHRDSGKPFLFKEISDEYRRSFDKRLSSDEKTELAEHVRELVDKNKLGFEDGKTYYKKSD